MDNYDSDSKKEDYTHILFVNLDYPNNNAHLEYIPPMHIITEHVPETPGSLEDFIKEANPDKIFFTGVEKRYTLDFLEKASGYNDYGLPPFLMERKNREILALEKKAGQDIFDGYFPVMLNHRDISTLYTNNSLVKGFCQLNNLRFKEYAKP